MCLAFCSVVQIVMADPVAGVFRDCDVCPDMIGLPEKGYAIGKFEVTFDDWDACLAEGGCNGYKPAEGKPAEQWGRGGRPVIYVSWDDAQAYIEWLSRKTGKSYRLPSKEEWEYACYGGRKTKYCGGDDIKAVAWYEDNSAGQNHPVGEKRANGYGLYDMSGNVWEWTDTCWEGDCGLRVIRGGGSVYEPQLLQATISLRFLKTSRSYSYGFRLARSLP
ncbi:MAG: formylglycine-generating enzyme family protein [Nitrosomonadales bacterium]|nr:formylglycine-generating enzyme family protein [Nitrosomonadales bacterium]